MLLKPVNYFQHTRLPTCDFTGMKISVIRGLSLDRIKSSPNVCSDSCARLNVMRQQLQTYCIQGRNLVLEITQDTLVISGPTTGFQVLRTNLNVWENDAFDSKALWRTSGISRCLVTKIICIRKDRWSLPGNYRNSWDLLQRYYI